MTIIKLLPPDPSKPGSYWIARRGDGFCDMWDWLPDDQEWWRRTDDGDVCSPEEASRMGYTFPKLPVHPIPNPAALEKLYAAVEQMHREKEAALKICNLYVVGTVDFERESTRAAAYTYSARLLCEALETKETT